MVATLGNDNFRIAPFRVKRAASLEADLELDTVGIVEFMIDLEAHFGIKLEEVYRPGLKKLDSGHMVLDQPYTTVGDIYYLILDKLGLSRPA